MPLDPIALLGGPRGRRLCLEFASTTADAGTPDREELSTAIFFAAYALDPGRGTSVALFGGDTEERPRPSPRQVAELLGAAALAPATERAISVSLAACVDNARYWQPPDGADVLAATADLQGALTRVATHILDASHTAWWTDSVHLTDQWAVTFTDDTIGSPNATSSATEILVRWRDAQRAEEFSAERDRPRDPNAAWSGTWWSKPPSALTRTTRSVAGRGPAGLSLVEDAVGWNAASGEQIGTVSEARIYEIDAPDDWAELCRRYPLNATASRQHDWYHATGRSGDWVIPDWARVARDFDAVHLSVGGYLTTAGRAIPLDDAVASVLAGWDPDQTYWLCDVPRLAETRQTWARTPGDGTWTQVESL